MRRATLIAAGIAAVAGIWILSGQFGGEGKIPAEKGMAEGQTSVAEDELPRVRVTNSEAMSRIQELAVFGRTAADRVVDVRAETSGRVMEILIEEGDAVQEDEQLVRLAMDDRQSRLAEAQAQLKYREIAYDAAQELAKKKFSAEVTVAEDLAALETAKASLRAIRLDIARTRIKAPFGGLVEESPLNIGDLVQVGDIVAQLVDLDPIVVVVEVTERQIAQVHVGQSARMAFPNGARRDGKVTFVSRSGSDETRTFRVEIDADNRQLDIPQGLTADVTLMTAPAMAHRITPAVLTLNDQGQVGVKIVDDKDQVVFVPVGIVAETTDGVWVDGLEPSVRLITVGQEFVSDGQTVIPVPSDGA